MKAVIFATIFLCASFSAVAHETPDTVNLSRSASPVNTLSPEGIWQFGADDAIFEIRPQKGRHGTGNDRNITRQKNRNFIFTFDPSSCTLTIRPYKKGTRVNILRWIPYLFRLSVDRTDSRPSNIDGARRLCPDSPSYPVIL